MFAQIGAYQRKTLPQLIVLQRFKIRVISRHEIAERALPGFDFVPLVSSLVMGFPPVDVLYFKRDFFVQPDSLNHFITYFLEQKMK